jgi:hypothetical protein
MRTTRGLVYLVGVLFCFTSVLVAPGCSGDESPENGPADAHSTDTSGDTDAGPESTVREASLVENFGDTTLASGEETSPCVQWSLQNDEPIYVNTVTLGTDGGYHHSNWFVVPDRAFRGDDGFFNCGDRGFSEIAAAIDGTVLFAQSTQAREEVQKLPEGVVIKIPPNHKVIGSLHLLNIAPRELTTGLRMQLDAVHPGDVDTVVTPFRLTYQDLDIPANSETRFSADCNIAGRYEGNTDEPFDIKLYWVLPHYHELGNYFNLEILGGERDGEQLFELAGFNAEANGQAFSPPVEMSGANGFRFSCGFDNPRAESVGWGIGDQEMCVMLGFVEGSALIDATVYNGNHIVETSDGIVYQEGECTVAVIAKNESQTMPSDEEVNGAMYVPPTDAEDTEVDPIPECEDTPDDAAAGIDATLSGVQAQVFSVGCAFSSCHDTGSPAANLDLTADDIHAELMDHQVLASTDLPLVDPGNADGSWLYKILAECAPKAGETTVSHMPRNSPTLLDPELVAGVRDWIDDGAQDN